MGKLKDDLYIIIVTYNGMHWLKTCLDSCKGYRVLVVDNASTDNTTVFIESNYPEVILFKQDQNLGFGQANNLGVCYALDQGAEHVFLLNQDAYLVDDVLEELITLQKEQTDFGVLSPVHITGDKKKLDKNFSKFMVNEITDSFYSDFVLGNTLADIYEVPFVNAAAWLLSRKCIETVGGFDTLFFHYGEDQNYCHRVRYHGFKIGVLPSVYVIHDRGERESMFPMLYSVAYQKNREKHYKVKFANINEEMQLDLRIKQLRQTYLKYLMQFNLKNARGIYNEISILKKNKPFIIKSRSVNKLPGLHYLKNKL